MPALPACPALNVKGLLPKENAMKDRIINDPSNDGVDRRGFLKCMAWAGTGMVWAVSGGILGCSRVEPNAEKAKADSETTATPASFTFVQVSDSHLGFSRDPNRDVAETYREAIAKINALGHARQRAGPGTAQTVRLGHCVERSHPPDHAEGRRPRDFPHGALDRLSTRCAGRGPDRRADARCPRRPLAQLDRRDQSELRRTQQHVSHHR
jgi:hypothetical protein